MGENVGKGKVKTEQKSIINCLNDAKDEIASLADEMSEWRDNMEGTNLEYTSKYETVSESADTLEDQSSSLEDVISEIEEIKGFNLEKTTEVTLFQSKRPSRRDRLDMATTYLSAAKDELQDQVDEIREKVRQLEELDTLNQEQQKEKETLEESADNMEDQLNELDNIISELEGIEFPGMYG
jgi:methyl-accepting chemotaxis protein